MSRRRRKPRNLDLPFPRPTPPTPPPPSPDVRRDHWRPSRSTVALAVPAGAGRGWRVLLHFQIRWAVEDGAHMTPEGRVMMQKLRGAHADAVCMRDVTFSLS